MAAQSLDQPRQVLTDSRFDYARSVLKVLSQDQPGAVVFDVGAGDAPMKAVAEGHGLEWHGFDLFPARDDIHRWDLSEPCPLPDKKADVLLLMDVIEHLFNPGLAVANLAAVLKPRAKIYLTMPNPHWSRSRIHNFAFGVPANFTQADLDVNHHVFTPLRHVLRKLLADNNLEIIDYVTLDRDEVGWPKPALSVRYPALCAEAVVRKVIEARDKSATGLSYALVAQAKA